MENRNGMSRRRALQLGAALAAGALGSAALAGCKKEEESAPTPAPTPTTYEMKIFDPTGSIEIKQLHAPRLDTLEGKTIGFVSDDAWEDDRTFAELKRLIERDYPSITIITQDNFTHGIEAITKDNNGIAPKMKEMGVDAAIVGNAG